jgi:hypothetical protein
VGPLDMNPHVSITWAPQCGKNLEYGEEFLGISRETVFYIGKAIDFYKICFRVNFPS